ncbi:MAG: hypothetical protein ACHBN1_18300 [Heteroscytonema crispum UTEX LB 1556]
MVLTAFNTLGFIGFNFIELNSVFKQAIANEIKDISSSPPINCKINTLSSPPLLSLSWKVPIGGNLRSDFPLRLGG